MGPLHFCCATLIITQLCANELVQHTPIIGLNWVNFIFSKGLVNASATLSPVDTYNRVYVPSADLISDHVICNINVLHILG